MSRLRAAKLVTRKAPIGGWNTRDPLSDMDPLDAPVLTNWMPVPGGIKQRTGYASHVPVNAAGIVGTLMEYAPPGGSAAFFAAIGADIYNVTAAGTLGASVYGSGALASPYWSHTMQTSAATSVLFLVNGTDSPVHWNGTSWANPSITGVTATTLKTVTNHKNRLWFTNGTLIAYYLPNNSIAGAATSFDLGPLAKKGGALVNIGTWTKDGGLGSDDYIVFLTDKGEAIVYAGTDPSSASTWGLVGTFQLAPPIGGRCMLRVGADLVIMTVRGLFPMSQAMTLAESGQGNAALTAKISPTFEAAATAQPTANHWQLIEYPKEKLLICNIPTSSTASDQYAMQTETLGWCKFEQTSATCWGIFGNNLYWGSSGGFIGKITGATFSENSGVRSKLLMSFQGNASRKRATMVRANMLSTASFLPRIKINTDYDTTLDSSVATSIDMETPSPNNKWQSSQGFGYVLAPGLYIETSTQNTLNSIDMMVEEGGPL